MKLRNGWTVKFKILRARPKKLQPTWRWKDLPDRKTLQTGIKSLGFEIRFSKKW